MQKYFPVISLAIRDENQQQSVLLGIRDPVANQTHPNVLSTPTQRIPCCLESELKRDVTLVDVDHNYLHFPERVHRTSIAVNAPVRVAEGNDKDLLDAILYVVQNLLSYKLEFGSTRPRFKAKLGSIVEGDALYDEPHINATPTLIHGQTVYAEPIRMYGIDVTVKNLQFPDATHSYSALRWVPLTDFTKIMKLRSVIPAQNLFGKESFGYCAHGLCLLSAAAILRK